MIRVALVGSRGQLGSDIVRAWPTSELAAAGAVLVTLTHQEIEITDPYRVHSVLEAAQPDVVINAAAFVRVDESELNPGLAMQVNGIGARNLASACSDLAARMVQASSDYVFDGLQDSPYCENDVPGPVNAYGVSKLAGEEFVRSLRPDAHIIVRSSGLYGVSGASGKGGNFVETMIRQARANAPIRVVHDQVTSPTFTLDLAATLLAVIARGGQGTFHVTNGGQCSWYEFAGEIFRLLGLSPDLAPLASAGLAGAARRPPFSVLCNERLADLGLDPPRAWRKALADYLRQKGYVVLV